MMEHMKTILLIFLVSISLMQSIFLVYSIPNFDVRQKISSGYVKTDPLGPEEKLENLIFPEQLILHVGGNKHTILYPEMAAYKIILKRLQKRAYDRFQLCSLTTMDWIRIREQQPGIELSFPSPVPATLLQKVFPLASDATLLKDNILRIGLFTMYGTNKVSIYFFNAKGTAVYECTYTDLTAQDIQQQINLNQAETGYKLVHGTYYVPEQSLQQLEVHVPYRKITAEQMRQSLFHDPTVTKNIKTDHAEIYTDVKRGLEVNQARQWLTYSDPAVQVEAQQDISAKVTAAVRFINQHGGWNGRYQLTLSTDNKQEEVRGVANKRGKIIRFQQYWGSHPIVNTNQFQFGYIQTVMLAGMVTSYERSLVQLYPQAMKEKICKLSGGSALLNKLNQLGNKTEITKLRPVYVPTQMDKYIRLSPVWQVQYKNGPSLFVE